MLFRSQDVKLSNISRALQEEVALIRTEKRLSRNLKSAELAREEADSAVSKDG